MEEAIRDLRERARKIGEGTYLTVEQTDALTEYLFREGKGEYIGVESNLPSTFYAFYPTYLARHERYPYPSSRILLVSSAYDLHNDYMRDPENVQRFLEWHIEQGVDLRYFYRSEAQALARRMGLPSTDVGVWMDSYAVFFRPAGRRIWMRFVERGTDLFERAVEYARAVLEASEQVREIRGRILSRRFFDIWGAYVGDRAVFHAFLERLLSRRLPRRNSVIYDVAAGLGLEAEYLLARGFVVDMNEVDIEFNRYLRQRFPDARITAYDWREMDVDRKYGAVLCVGNSLSMLPPEDRLDVLRTFRELLVDGGLLIIDERNYPSIVRLLSSGSRRKSEIMGALGAWDYMYNGPVDPELRFEDGSVVFRFDADGHVGDIETYPFRPGELLSLLRAAGFGRISIYADLRPVRSPRYERNAYNLYVAVR